MTNIQTYRSLAERWWQWAASIPTPRNPLTDETGEFAAEGQPDDVWFLAGTMGGAVKRQCSIPSDQPIFFPMFNIVRGFRRTLLFRGTPAPVCPQASGSAELNGVSLPVYEVSNQKKFTINAVPESPLHFKGDVTVKAWGLWGYLEPLDPGTYVLTFQGEIRPGGFWVSAKYDLTVV
ncbi:hypothetical protein Pth03_47090 [Planotetraspora thailandica]|uniref:Uncharacterized protein n=1 Tax=Planotetraspora thailandica TaxID=487172 RepID=A0A8J3V588_9ACTN|nr:hypothetical protein [Planotetraspora thailandica]GII56320.1 hypothetical protein Pth03_47090 [Planotetraspora thailandica]